MKSTLPRSTVTWRTLAGVCVGLTVLSAFLIACHVGTTQRLPWAPWLYFLPLLAMVLASLASHWGRAVAGVLGVLIVALMMWGLPRWHGELSVLYYLEHVGANLALGWMFGHTLLGGREPLVTRFARILRDGDMPPEVLSFTRGATLAWTLFFAGIATVSTALYLGASVAAWSTFSNLMSSPLVGLMFVGEYLVRRYKLRGIQHHSILDGMRSFHQFRSASPSGPPAHERR
ncbi:MAG: hypothetical protein KGL90_07240 [Burkholderiales bacterium]|nr:hypothetical protein [Burkholderiales bacterium]